MPCIQAAKEPREKCGHYATNDPLLCVTLSTLGFKLRANLPISITFDAGRIVQLVDRNTGEVDKLATVQHVFEFDCHSPEFGRLVGPQIFWAQRLAEFGQKRDRGDLSGAIDAQIAEAKKKCNEHKVTVQLALVVKFLYDQITNWNVYTSVVHELSKNPFLKFQRLLTRGIASVAHPLEAESSTFKRHEKLFRGMQ
jgi:hypothetical protein